MAVRGRPPKEFSIDSLVGILRRLDALLENAAVAAEAAYGTGIGADPFRGLHIGFEDVRRLLDRVPAASPLWSKDVPVGPVNGSNDRSLSGLAWLQEHFGLNDFDLDVILVALAPEIDLKYERLYAYLQDDVSRRRPTVDLALNLLCRSAEERLARRKRFAADAPLVGERLIHLIADPHAVHPPLLAHDVKLDEQIVRLVLGEDALDSRLASFCEMVEPRSGADGIPLADAVTSSLQPLIRHAWAEGRALTLYLHGPAGVGKRHTVQALAGEIDVRLLAADLRRAPTTAVDFESAIRFLLRDALFHDAIVYLDGLDELKADDDASRYRVLMDALEQDTGVTILAGERSWVPDARGPKGVLSVALPMPGFAYRRACWQLRLAERKFRSRKPTSTRLPTGSV